MAHPESKFADAADYTEACCGPELPHDTAEDVFLDARLRVKLPPEIAAHVKLILWWSREVFREFWQEWDAQEHGHGASRTFGDEAAIRLLQALTGSRTRQMAMRAECYLAVINRKPESQTEIARKYGVTRAAVSKVIVSIKDDLDLPTARHMKSDTARESYRTRALRIHKERKSNLCKTPNSNSYNRLLNLKASLMPKLAPAS